MWIGSCAMTVRAGGQQAPAESGAFPFTVASATNYELSFVVSGSPATPGDLPQITTSLSHSQA
jgi:hypothetical protein